MVGTWEGGGGGGHFEHIFLCIFFIRKMIKGFITIYIFIIDTTATPQVQFPKLSLLFI